MPKFEGVVLVKKAGQIVPEATMESVLLHNPTVFGFAMPAVHDKKKIVSVVRQPLAKLGDLNEQLSKLMGVIAKHKDEKSLLFFGKYPEGYNADDMQPFALLFNEVSGGRPTVVACLDGEYSDKLFDGHSEQFKEMNEYLTPKLLPVYESLNYDPGMLMTKLRNSPLNKEISGYFSDAKLTLFDASGTSFTLGSKENAGYEYDWGWMSKNYSAKAEETPVIAPIVVPEVDPLEADFGIEAAPAAKPPVVDPNRSQIGASNGKAKPTIASTTPIVPKTSVPASSSPGSEMKAPEKGWSNKTIKRWYNQNTGSIPENWKDCPAVPVKVNHKTLGSAAAELKNGTADLEQAVSQKDTTTKHVATAEVKPEVKPAAIPTEQHKEFLDNFMKDMVVSRVDRSDDTINDPALLSSMEQDNPTFAELAKLKSIEQSFTWSPQRRKTMVRKYPDMAESYIFDLICENVDSWRTIQRLQKQITALKSGKEEDAAPLPARQQAVANTKRPTQVGGQARRQAV